MIENTEIMETLEPTEQDELRRLEVVISKGIRNFVEVGRALAAIRDKRLYRATNKSFEGYVRERFDLSRSYAHELIDASSVLPNLSGMPNTQLPANARQALPLARLEPDQQRMAWATVVKEAKGKPITCRLVEQVVSTLKSAVGRFRGGNPETETARQLNQLISELKTRLKAMPLEEAISRLQRLIQSLEGLAEEEPEEDQRRKDLNDLLNLGSDELADT